MAQQSGKVLVVGAGVTGATLAHLLQDARLALKHVPEAVVWEKNNIAGGRMMARSFLKNREVHVDIGAQYLTKFTVANDDIRTLLAQKRKLVPFDESAIAQDAYHQAKRTDGETGKAVLEHAVCPDSMGFRSIVQQLLEDTPVTLSKEVKRFEILNKLQIKVIAVDGSETVVNNLVLTCPVPNVLTILENSSTFAASTVQVDALKAVQYSQRFALAYLFDAGIAKQVQELGWTSKYVSRDEDDVVRYMCWDNLKKQPSAAGVGSPHFALLVHTSVPFGVKHMDNKQQNGDIVAMVTKSVKKLLPFLPTEEDVVLHRWRISQVTKPYTEPSTATGMTPTGAIVLNKSPKIVVAGDAFLGSTFDNCLLSAKAAADIIVKSSALSSGFSSSSGQEKPKRQVPALAELMGITRVRRDVTPAGGAASNSNARGDQFQLLPLGKKSSEVRTCVSVFDGDPFVINNSSGNKADKDEHVEEVDACETSGGYQTNQFGAQLGDVDLSDRVAPHMTSRLAALNRELKALEVRYFRTRLQLEKSMEKNNQLRQDMTKLRGHSTKLERDTCKLRNLVDRIQGEKKQLELQAINNRDYAKKIEQRFFMGTKGQSIVQCNIDLSSQVKSLERLMQEKAAALESQRLELQDANEKLRILKRALETRFEEMQINGSLHTGILFELTRLQDQSASLALQLSDEHKNAKALQTQLSVMNAKECELDEALLVREAMIGNLERERVALEEKLATLWNEKQTFTFEKSTLLKFIQEQAEVKFQLDAQVKRMHESKLADLAALHQKLQFSMEEKAKLQDSLRESSFHSESLERECQTLKSAFEDEQHAKLELQAREQELTLHAQQLSDDLSKKDDDFKAARDVCRELQAAVESYEHETQQLRTRIAELEAIEAELQQQLTQKQSEELALRAAMENALHDLEMLSKQRNEAAKAMNEAVTISASSLDEQQALEARIEAQRKQLEQLKNSKNLLQNAMLEQLSALRKQLQLERIQRIHAEAKVKQLFEFSSPSRKDRDRREAAQLKPKRHPESPHSLEKMTVDHEEPQPLPPPMMAGVPSPLPAHLSSLGRYSGGDGGDDDARSESSVSSSSSSSVSEKSFTIHETAPLKPQRSPKVSSRPFDSSYGSHAVYPVALSVQIPAQSLAAGAALSNSPEFRAGHVPPLVLEEQQISLLELAGDL